MINLHEKICPYKGTAAFQLGDSLEHIRMYLKKNRIPFNQSTDPNIGCTPEIPWIFIEINQSITLCFVMDILFEIVFENMYSGNLHNNVRIGMMLTDAEIIDPTLTYNEEDEDYVSTAGYWLEDNPETGKICSITVYLPEVENEDFFSYTWTNKYKAAHGKPFS